MAASGAVGGQVTARRDDAGFPANAVRYCLGEAGIGLGDVDHVVFYDKPFLKFERLLETYLSIRAGMDAYQRAEVESLLGDLRRS